MCSSTSHRKSNWIKSSSSTITLETVIVAPLIELDIVQVIVAVASASLLLSVSPPVVSVTAYILNVGVNP